jgi:hypothetical protein
MPKSVVTGIEPKSGSGFAGQNQSSGGIRVCRDLQAKISRRDSPSTGIETISQGTINLFLKISKHKQARSFNSFSKLASIEQVQVQHELFSIKNMVVLCFV